MTWNTGELTAQALRKLLDGDQGCKLRVLAYDNGSTDGTVQTLARVVPEVEVYAGPQNLGFAAGVNRLLPRSTAPWVFLLNSDAWPQPGTIATLVNTAKRYPSAAAVAPRLEFPEGGLQHSVFPFPGLRVAVVSAFLPRRIGRKRGAEMMLEGFWMHDRPRVVDWAIGAALLVRRSALEDIGLLDERFFMYVEDLEWEWRAHKQGWEIRFEPSAVVLHVGNASGDKDESARARAYLLNSNQFYRTEHGLAAAIAYRTLNLAGASLRYLSARRRRDQRNARFWRANMKAHLMKAPNIEPHIPKLEPPVRGPGITGEP